MTGKLLTSDVTIDVDLFNLRVAVIINPYSSTVIYYNFKPLEVVSRYRDPQLQVAENYLYLFNLGTNICNY